MCPPPRDGGLEIKRQEVARAREFARRCGFTETHPDAYLPGSEQQGLWDDLLEQIDKGDTMGAFVFGERSRKNLVGVHPNMVLVAARALTLSPVDFFVNEGVRTPARQKELYAQGRTKPGNKVTWTLNSNHFVNPRTGYGHAIDVYAAPYNPNQKFVTSVQIARAMLKAADELDIPIRWGADWDMDGNFGERGEGDSPHFELWGA